MAMIYCPSCEEDSPGCGSICQTCGDTLVLRPTVAGNNEDVTQQSPHARDRQDDNVMSPLDMAMLATSMGGAGVRLHSNSSNDMNNNGDAMIDPSMFASLANRLRGNPNGVGARQTGIEDLAGMLPPEAFDPQAGTVGSRPASQKALDNLKRTVLLPESAELFDAQVRLFEKQRIDDPLMPLSVSSKSSLVLNAVPGEFLYKTRSNRTNANSRNSALVICSPRTVKGGKLSTKTLSQISFLRQHRIPFICYVERGDGVTFVQKALACQRAGEMTGNDDRSNESQSMCIGVIVGNATSGRGKEIWPYTMQDNGGEAHKFGLSVPVVMIRRDDGIRLLQWSSAENATTSNDMQTYTPCQISIHSKEADSHTCPVCTDSYAPGDTIIRLPLCGHVFHESCALAWLQSHNTCPFCRKELPTDDDAYERGRRRREATANAEQADSNINGNSFYG